MAATSGISSADGSLAEDMLLHLPSGTLPSRSTGQTTPPLKMLSAPSTTRHNTPPDPQRLGNLLVAQERCQAALAGGVKSPAKIAVILGKLRISHPMIRTNGTVRHPDKEHPRLASSRHLLLHQGINTSPSTDVGPALRAAGKDSPKISQNNR